MPVVILPFLSEKFKPASNQTHYIWCTDTSDDLNGGLVPIEYSSALESSLFREESLAEKQYYIVDAVNTAYVAFTRPKNELIVYAKRPKETKNGLVKDSVADMLYKYLTDTGNLNEDGIFEAGELFEYQPESDAVSGHDVISLDRYDSVCPEGNDPDNPRIRLLGRGRNFFEREKMRQRGIVMHDILSAIATADDIDSAVEEAVLRGEVSAEEAAGCAAEIRRMVAYAAHYGWFAPGAQILNEVSIIDSEGNVARPDRVVVSEADSRRSAVVVDYKFGKPDSAYAKQVAGYMKLLEEMGYAEVKGYLWYAADDNIVPVSEADVDND